MKHFILFASITAVIAFARGKTTCTFIPGKLNIDKYSCVRSFFTNVFVGLQELDGCQNFKCSQFRCIDDPMTSDQCVKFECSEYECLDENGRGIVNGR